MIISIHQPNFIPWLGLFYKIFRSDIFVILDDVQYTKNSFINRNKIKTPSGEQWLTVPVKSSGNFGIMIKEIEIHSPETTFKKISGTLISNYKKAKHFDDIFSLLEPAIKEASNLSILNEDIIRIFCDYFCINTQIVRASSLTRHELNSSDRLVHICNELHATTYLSGFGGKNYQDEQKFRVAGINCETYDFIHPQYPQLWGNFIPNLSALDFICNVGKHFGDYFE